METHCHIAVYIVVVVIKYPPTIVVVIIIIIIQQFDGVNALQSPIFIPSRLREFFSEHPLMNYPA